MTRYPLLLMFILLGLSLLAWLWMPISFGLGISLLIFGGGLFAFGLLLLVLAAGLFRLRGTTVDPTRAPDKLVTDGVYRLSRNPMYLGMLLVLLGMALLLNSVLSLVFPLLFFVLINRLVIPREEQRVEEVFGEQFALYKQRTRRWL
ncbi:methyltransferase family protein [Bowmanella dokdonensis]|uniref:DUF1295 domain-containing protein n=1 Tax=Bowmanella dokdonensis TaxID=751969 RepID=A0A939DQD6_9ALTE|nr:methyltransferase [Bowmanella dokdonensis]MBN7826865.1 DUF1295 domain-containing protein [Bowmanella dokdonensis]